MVLISIFAGLLLILAIIILVKNSSIHRRGALLTGIMALWLWGMAFALAEFVNHCRRMSFVWGDPAAAAQALGRQPGFVHCGQSSFSPSHDPLRDHLFHSSPT